jgi:16S rRNA (guanine527-N7)-methyltransferase
VTAPERQELAQEAVRLGVQLGSLELGRLDAYVEILRVWNKRVRMLGDRDPSAIYRKHIPDCLALVPFLPTLGPIVDIGTGAGLPGIVLTCVRPDMECWLIESRRRRVSFLQEVKATLGLEHAVVVEGRAEDVASQPRFCGNARAATGRAVSLETLLELGHPLLEAEGHFLAMQSQRTSIEATRFTARRNGLTIVNTRDYRLRDGELRRIVVLGRC